MNYEQAAAFVEDTKKYGSILGLDSIRSLMHALGNPQEKLKIVHVAGTNGKGSVCAFLSAVLTEHNYKVGRFQTPAVFDPREILRIGEDMIPEAEYAEIMTDIELACKQLLFSGKPHPTVFEVETAAAFLWFYRKKVDIALIEVGMGGETDATNLITTPLCSVITSIDMDHMQFLGNQLADIVYAKAGIIKPNCPVVAMKQTDEINDIIFKQANQKNAVCIFSDVSQAERMDEPDIRKDVREGWSLEHPYYGKVTTFILGDYQAENLYLALDVLKVLSNQGVKLDKKKVCAGVKKAVWHGRFEVIAQEPMVIIDGAHNPAATARLKETLEKNFTNRKIIYIIGVLADKNYIDMLKEPLKLAKKAYTVTPDNPRALNGALLAQEVSKLGIAAEYTESVSDAVNRAVADAEAEDVIVAFGSLSYLNEVKESLWTQRK